MVRQTLISKIFLSLLCAALGYAIFIQAQILGINILGIAGSAVLGLAPVALDWFNKYNAKLNNITKVSDVAELSIKRIDELNVEINTKLDNLHNRLNNLATESDLDKVRAEAYSARGEAQQALNIVNMALDQSATAQRRINDLLSSGVIFKLCEITTRIELKQHIIENTVNKNTAILKQDHSNY